MYDVVDEVDFWMQDGGGSTDQNGAAPRTGSSAMGLGREEIKELVQDD